MAKDGSQKSCRHSRLVFQLGDWKQGIANRPFQILHPLWTVIVCWRDDLRD